MNKRLIPLLILFLTSSIVAFSQAKSVARPKLVVGIVVDQMRWDYLYKYHDRYSGGGFKKLMNEGFNCEQTYINYLPAYTAPGHACAYTGSVPSIHGIAGNDWIDNATGRRWYCVEDTTVSPVGGSRLAGRMSPRTLFTTTITDELRLATNQRSRVFGISLKDRGSIIPAGHLGNGAYWYDDSTGSLISSTYYGAALPQWLQTFNSRRLPDTLLRQDWETLYPIETYKQSIDDGNVYESLMKGENSPNFPHRISKTIGYGNLRRVPAGNTYSFEAAKACIAGEQLGLRGETDFFCLSLSTPDYIGHLYAPTAVETEDQYLRLDRELAAFLQYLDKQVGKGQYTVFLTADHGGAYNHHYLQSINIPAGGFPDAAVARALDSVIRGSMGDSLIRTINNYQVFLNERAIASRGTNRQELKNRIKALLYARPEIAYVADLEDMNSSAIPEPIRSMIVNGYNRKRSGVLQIILDPAWYEGTYTTGTTHGTWHPYDTHIPLLWYGWGINKGVLQRKVGMQDIAPTLAALLKIQTPNGCVGEVISEVVR